MPRTGDQLRSAPTLGPETEARRGSARSSLIQPAETSPGTFRRDRARGRRARRCASPPGRNRCCRRRGRRSAGRIPARRTASAPARSRSRCAARPRQRRIAVCLRDRAAGRKLGIAEHLAFDIAGQPELQLADILLDAEAAFEGLLDRLVERALDRVGSRGRFRADLVADRAKRLPIPSELVLERAVRRRARVSSISSPRNRLAEIDEGVDRRLVARPIGNGVEPQRRFPTAEPARRRGWNWRWTSR